MKNTTKISIWLDTTNACDGVTALLADVRGALTGAGHTVLGVEYEGDYDSTADAQDEADQQADREDAAEFRRLRAYGNKQAGDILHRREK